MSYTDDEVFELADTAREASESAESRPWTAAIRAVLEHPLMAGREAREPGDMPPLTPAMAPLTPAMAARIAKGEVVGTGIRGMQHALERLGFVLPELMKLQAHVMAVERSVDAAKIVDRLDALCAHVDTLESLLRRQEEPPRAEEPPPLEKRIADLEMQADEMAEGLRKQEVETRSLRNARDVWHDAIIGMHKRIDALEHGQAQPAPAKRAKRRGS